MNNPEDVVQAYFNTWNAGDADSIASLLTEEDEYHDQIIKILSIFPAKLRTYFSLINRRRYYLTPIKNPEKANRFL